MTREDLILKYNCVVNVLHYMTFPRSGCCHVAFHFINGIMLEFLYTQEFLGMNTLGSLSICSNVVF